MSSSTCLGGVGLWTFLLSPDMSLDSVVCLKSSCQGDKSIEFRTEDNISSNTSYMPENKWQKCEGLERKVFSALPITFGLIGCAD